MSKIKDTTVQVWQDALDAQAAANEAVALAQEAVMGELGDAESADSKLGTVSKAKAYRVNEEHLRGTFKAVHAQCAVETVVPVLEVEGDKA